MSIVSGVYEIRNRNGKRYIGSSINLKERGQHHLSMLRARQHGNRHLQRAFDKDGESAFMFSVLERVEDSARLIEREQYFFDILKPEYNLSLTADSRYSLGHHHSEETKKKMSESHKIRLRDRGSKPGYKQKWLVAARAKRRKFWAWLESPESKKRMAETEEMMQVWTATHNAWLAKHPRQYEKHRRTLSEMVKDRCRSATGRFVAEERDHNDRS